MIIVDNRFSSNNMAAVCPRADITVHHKHWELCCRLTLVGNEIKSRHCD